MTNKITKLYDSIYTDIMDIFHKKHRNFLLSTLKENTHEQTEIIDKMEQNYKLYKYLKKIYFFYF